MPSAEMTVGREEPLRKTSVVKGFAFFLLLAGLAVLSFAAKVYLKDGRVLEGEILSFDAYNVTIKVPTMDAITIARSNILKIDPPLDEKKPIAAPAQAGIPAEPQRTVPPRQKRGFTFGFSLSGGMSSVNGGDLNSIIRDTNTHYADLNDYNGSKLYAIDFNEMKSFMNFKGEFFVRFGRHLGIGMGLEFLTKKGAGMVKYSFQDSIRSNYSTDYDISWRDYKYTIPNTLNLTVIPITLNVYGFLPLNSALEFFGFAGFGYYLGTLKNDISGATGAFKLGYDYYLNNGSPDYPWYYTEDMTTYNLSTRATCNTLGFQVGAGGQFKLALRITVFGQIFYRNANFDNWIGDLREDLTTNYKYGMTYTPGTGPTTGTDKTSNSVTKGKAWYYDLYDNDLKQMYYGNWSLYETGPSEDATMKNVRRLAININGIAFQIGVRIGFGRI